MKNILFVLIISVLFTSCRRIVFSEYRKKDYYLIQDGNHYFFNKEKTFEKPVLKEVYNSTVYDTCSCISVINKTSEIQFFNQILLGLRFKIKIYSRDWYSSFPHDGSIESIENINVFLKNKNETVEISKYLINHVKLRDNIIYTNNDSSTFNFNKGVYFNSKSKCFKSYSVNNLNDFREKFNQKKFDDGLNTVDWYMFLFSILPDCPYKIKDFQRITTVLTLKTRHTKRIVKFNTTL